MGDELVLDQQFASQAQHLAQVRTLVAALASKIPTLNDARIADLKLVVTELFTNALEANQRAAGDGDVPPVGLYCRAAPDELIITITDSGSGFESSGEPHPPVEDPERLEFERGLGLPLIQYLADNVDYVTGASGTRATVILRNRS